MKNFFRSLAVVALLCGSANAQVGQVPIGPSGGGGGGGSASPCTEFGTASGQCAQGGVITAGGPTGSATVAPIITYNAAGQLTVVSSATITPAVGSITGLGSGVATALGNTAGGAGGFALVSGANVASVSNSDGTLTISPMTGAVVASIALGHANTWSGAQTFSAAINETTAGSVFGAVNTTTALLAITSSTGTLPTPATGTGLLLVGEGTNAGHNIDDYHYGATGPSYNLNYAAGTLALPTASVSGHTIGVLNFNGYTGSAFATGAQFFAQIIGGNWSGSNQGTLFEWSTTPAASTTVGSVMVLYQGLWVGSGTGSSDPGIGNFKATGRISLGSTTLPAGQAGDVAQIKETDAAAAPGAGYAVLKWVAGTNAGSCKLIGYAGTSATPVTIVDNIGSGC